MDMQSENTMEILDRHISGFRQYTLDGSVAPTFISQNFCEMVGYTKDELVGEGAVAYASLIHPADRAAYEDYLAEHSVGRRSGEAEYRLIRKDGSVVYVRDTMTVETAQDGGAVG